MWEVLNAGVHKLVTQVSGSQLRRNMASGTAMMVINIAIGLAMYPIYLHYLGYEKYGVWLILATVLYFIQLGGNLGVEPAVTKLVAEEYGGNNIRGIQSYVTMALATITVSGTIGLVLILCLKTQIVAAFKLSGENAKLALQLLPYIGVLCIYVFIVRVLNATVSGLGRMDLFNYIQTGGRAIVLIVAVLLLHSGRGVESLLIGQTASYIAMHIASLVFIRRIVNVRFLRAGNLDNERFKKLLRFGGSVFGSSLLAMLVSPFNKLMLARHAGVATIPIYELAFTGAMMVRGPIEFALKAIMPEVSRLSGISKSSAQKQIKNIIRKSTKLILLMGIPMCGFLLLLAEPLLKVWLRGRYLETIPVAFRIMLIAVSINLLCAPAYHALMGLGRVHHCVMSSVIISIGNVTVVLCVLFLAGFVSVNTIGFGLMASYAAGTVYLVCKIHQVMKRQSNGTEAF